MAVSGEKIIGIDLGTTNSVVSIMEGGEPRVIANQEGSRTTPSVIAFTTKGETLVGEPAKRQAVTNPQNTIYSIKRFMGRRHREVESEEKLVSYKVVGGVTDYVKVDVHGKEYTPPEISALVLRKLKEAAENYLGQKSTRPSSRFLPTSMTLSDRRPKMPDRSLAWKSLESSTSRPLQLLHMDSTRRKKRKSVSSTSVAVHSTCRFLKWVMNLSKC